MLREDYSQKIPSGCAISGIMNKKGIPVSGQIITDSIATMHLRSNGLGGGFAVYGIYPEYSDSFAFHMFYDDTDAKLKTEQLLREYYNVAYEESIPVRKTMGIQNAPLIYRYFAVPKIEKLNESELEQDDFTVKFVFMINTNVAGACIFSSGKNMGVFKAVGYPEDVSNYYRLESYKGYIWTAHGRFPTNTQGSWGGAHPFNLLDYSIVHNGELSSYEANVEFIEQYGYKCTFKTDTEVAAYIFDLLVRKHKLPFEVACKVVASPLWSEVDRMEDGKRDFYKKLKMIYGRALLNGPFSMILSHSGGFVAINDRLKLRPLTAASKGDLLMVASEESAIREVLPKPDKVWIPRGGEPVIGRIENENTEDLDLSKEVTA